MGNNIKQKQEQLLNLVTGFCSQKLNEEYIRLADKLIDELASADPVPFLKGKLEIWAAAIIHALGSINWMFDRGNKYYTPAADINEFFGTNGSSTSNKARLIRDMLDIEQGDPDFSTQDTKDNDPLAKFVLLDGIVVPITMLPVALQEQVKKARAEGRDIEFKTR